MELGNILVISQLVCEKKAEPQILDLLRQNRFKVLLTYRKTEGAEDHAMYLRLGALLQPILRYVFTLEEPKPEWT